LKILSFKNDLQYIEFGFDAKDLFRSSWKNYENIFCECTNLKGIKFSDWSVRTFDSSSILADKFDWTFASNIPSQPTVHSEIEVKRRNFLQSLGIKILAKDEFNLKEQELFKSVPWRLEIDINTDYESD